MSFMSSSRCASLSRRVQDMSNSRRYDAMNSLGQDTPHSCGQEGMDAHAQQISIICALLLGGGGNTEKMDRERERERREKRFGRWEGLHTRTQ